MKAGNRYRFSPGWTIGAAILLGMLAGYLVGRTSILRATRSRLVDYSGRLLAHDKEIAVEVDNTLTAANASSAPPCSDADIILLRRLTFASRFIKDVGRLQQGVFICSAATGKVIERTPMLTPDFTDPSGTSIYRNHPLSVPTGLRAEIASTRNADVVISPDIFAEFPQQPLHYFAGVIDREHNIIHSEEFGPVQVPPGVLEAHGAVRVNNALYAARCSIEYAVCAVAHISLGEVWNSNRGLLFGYIATGTAAGVACAIGLLMTGQKRRSHSNQLKRAILMGKLSVAYQPIVELASHRIVGAEALARWTDEDGESIRPETIIALAEAEGFVSEITRFVLTRSLDELKTILEVNPRFQLNINLAPSDLADPRLLLLLDEKLRNSTVTAQNLTFELTERATSNREVAISAIKRLRQRGHAVFIDDFGTGYSNLAYLTELDVDGIKINRSFIATIGMDSVTGSILPQILGVARALDLKIVVQGIERQEQATYFATKDSRILGQGWFFGMPIPARSLMYLCAEKTE